MSSKHVLSTFLALSLVSVASLQVPSANFAIDIAEARQNLQAAHTTGKLILSTTNNDTAALERSLNELRSDYEITSVRALSKENTSFLVTFAVGEDLGMVMAASDSTIKLEPDYILSAVAAPTDPQYGEQWYLRNTRQQYHTSSSSLTSGTLGMDINWQPGYEGSTVRGNGVTIALIDSGFTTTHPDLQDRLWRNSSETADGVDNDNNGLVDDINGWNFVNSNSNFTDQFGHGTQVAGVMMAKNDTVGIVGIASQAKIMPLKVLGSNGQGTSSDVIQAINYAVAEGAKVINMSLGGAFADSSALITACNNAVSNGVVVVAAAGNSNVDISRYHFAPANIATVIAVGSVTNTGAKASFSNTGTALSVVTPGVHIVTTKSPSGSGNSSSQVLPDGINNYIINSGTSFSSPMVAAAAALLLEKSPSLSVTQVRTQLQNTARDIGSRGKDTKFGYGLLDVGRALGIGAAASSSATTTPTVAVINKAPKIVSSSWNTGTFSTDTSDSIILTVRASDTENDTLTVRADFSVLGSSIQTLTNTSGTTYVATAITPTVPSGSYTIPLQVSDAGHTINGTVKLRVVQTAAGVTISKPSSRNVFTTNKTTLTLSGTVRGPVREVKINGESLSSFVSAQRKWTMPITLAVGTNVYTVVGYNTAGTAVATSTITITRTVR